MTTRILTAILLLIAVPDQSVAQDESMSDRANALFEAFYDEMLGMSPMTQSYMGVKWDYDKWDDRSESHQEAVLQMRLRQQAQLEDEIDYGALDEQTRLSYDLFKEQTERQVDAYRFRKHDYLLDQMYGWQSRIPSFLINIHRVDSQEDAEAYVARLHGVSALVDQVITLVDEQARLGFLPPKFVFEYVRSDSRKVIEGAPFDDGEDNLLLVDFKGKIDGLELDEDARSRLIDEARRALQESVGPAYRSLLAKVDEWQAMASTDDGVWRMTDGDDFYAFRLRVATTLDLDADTIHAIGLREVERIHGEMRQIMAQVGFEGTLREFFDFMRNDPQFYYENTDEGKAQYLADATAIIDSMRTQLDALFLRKPRADLVVKAVEPFREASAGKAFYERPSPDGTRPGTYYANLFNTANMPIYQMEALAYHEGIPGHHMQVAISQELEGIPRFRRFGSQTAYIEGWGLYSELVPREIGFYSDPYSDFGRLAMELWRACRLVVDTGLHHKRWTREEGIDYLSENTPNPPGDIRKAIERYIVMPGQATAYKIGMNKIVELRGEAQSRLGERFDVREFHDVILRYGPLPLSMLETIVRDWIEELRQS